MLRREVLVKRVGGPGLLEATRHGLEPATSVGMLRRQLSAQPRERSGGIVDGATERTRQKSGASRAPRGDRTSRAAR